MLAAKLTFSLAILSAISLHSTDAVTCQIPSEAVETVPATTVLTVAYTTLAGDGVTCTNACTACGQAVSGADDASTTTMLAAQVSAVGLAICPTITFSTLAAATATNGGALGLETPVTQNTFSNVLGGLSTISGTIGTGAGTVTSGAVTSNIVSHGRHANGADPVIADPAVMPDAGLICACTLDERNTCPTCGCNDLGVPTAAPSAAPTTAPTAVTSAPTSQSGSLFSSSDDSLSGGAIAGIVIGSIVGAALVIGAGVMIGSK